MRAQKVAEDLRAKKLAELKAIEEAEARRRREEIKFN
jgi:hypothetical protein